MNDITLEDLCNALKKEQVYELIQWLNSNKQDLMSSNVEAEDYYDYLISRLHKYYLLQSLKEGKE